MAPNPAEISVSTDDIELPVITEISPVKKYPGFGKNLKDYFTEYSSNTGIHGFKYLGEQRRLLVEKIYWLCFFCFSLYICISSIVDTWNKWKTTPAIVSFTHTPTPVWQIPFPAITICPETKSKQRVYNYTANYQKFQATKVANMTDEEIRNISYASLVCKNFTYKEGENFVQTDVIDFLTQIAPGFKEIFFSCRWTSLEAPCGTIFKRTLTEEGVCYTFNNLDTYDIFKPTVEVPEDYKRQNNESHGWTLEHGYPEDAEINTFPRRAMSEGVAAGLSVLTRMDQQDFDYVCRGGVEAFKILLHNPGEIPRVSNHYFFASLDDKETVVSIIPEIITTSPSLKGYDPYLKQCYFPYERELKYFKSYTQQNCQVECLTNLTLTKCGCVAYHMPYEADTPICGSGRIDCMKEAAAGILGDDIEAEHDLFEISCDCLPSCASISYNAEITQIDFPWKETYAKFQQNPDFNQRYSRIYFLFKETQFTSLERNEMFGWIGFLSNCGGLLGLFTGFSFMSIVEIVYFLSLKLICNVRHYGKYYWSGSKNLPINPTNVQ